MVEAQQQQDGGLVRNSVQINLAQKNRVLMEACAFGETLFRNVTGAAQHQAEARAQDWESHLRASIMESPIKPFWISTADSVMFIRLRKRALFAGSISGEGFIISRLPTPHPSLVKWSAPCFISTRVRLAGLSFGSQRVESFTCCLNSKAKQEFCKKGRHELSGVDAAMSCGTALQDKADVLSASSSDFGTVGCNLTRGTMFHIGYGWGTMSVDEAQNEKAYGPGGRTAAKLLLPSTTIEPPREMQPLYSVLNTCISTVEHVTPPSRVSASLERLTSGSDPDRHLVIPGGFVINEELMGPPEPKKIV